MDAIEIRDVKRLGQLIRRTRKQQGLTLVTLAGVCHDPPSPDESGS